MFESKSFRTPLDHARHDGFKKYVFGIEKRIQQKLFRFLVSRNGSFFGANRITSMLRNVRFFVGKFAEQQKLFETLNSTATH